MQGKVMTPAITAALQAANLTPEQVAVFDNLPWEPDHSDDDIVQAIEAIKTLEDGQAKRLSEMDSVDELFEIFAIEDQLQANVRRAATSDDNQEDPLVGLLALLLAGGISPCNDDTRQ